MEGLELFFENEVGTVYYTPSLNAVYYTSKGVVYLKEEFYEILRKITELISDKKCTKYLVNTTSSKMISQENQTWIVENWYPKVVAAGLKKQAIVVVKDSFSIISIEKIITQYDEKKLESRKFYNIEDAVLWLKEYE